MKGKKQRTNLAEIIREEFDKPEKIAVNWDGKIFQFQRLRMGQVRQRLML